MKKVALIVGLLVITLALNLEAGVSTEKNAWNAKDISISGGFDNTMLYRDQGLNSVLDGMQAPNKQKSDFIWTPLVTLNLGADVGDKILAFVQLQNRRLDNTALGTAANVDVLGGDNTELAVEQAYVKIEKLISDDLTLTYGAQNLKFTLRKDEGGFFLDVLKSENLAAPITEANGYRGFPLPKNTTEFAGFKFDYGSLKNANYDMTLFWGIASETGVAHADEKLMGLAARYKLPNSKDERDVLQGSYTIIAQDAARLNIHTIGLGVEYFSSMPNLELYGEYYTQSGDLTTNVAQDASAYRIGAKYDFKQKMAPYVDVSYWFLSGGGTATKSQNFVSYENVQSSLILEDNIFGLDLDSNYTALKVEAGISTQMDINKDGTGEPLTIKALFGQFNLADKPASMTVGQIVKDSLGQEIDVTATLQYNKSLAFALSYATLSSGDFFTSAGGYNADSGNMKMVVFDTKLKF